MSGILIAGELVPVIGMTIVPPASHGGPAWCQLGADDYRMRATAGVSQIIIHSTGPASLAAMQRLGISRWRDVDDARG